MKILLTSDVYSPATNGVVTSLVNLRQGLENLGHEVRILTLSENHHTSYTDGVWRLSSTNAGTIYPGTRVRDTLAKRPIQDLISWNPDIVHSQSEFSTFPLARRIAKACTAPLVHTYHTLYEDYTSYFSVNKALGRSLVQLFSRHVLSRTDAVIAPTQKISTLLQLYGVETPIQVIPSGIHLARFSSPLSTPHTSSLIRSLNLNPRDFVILYVGRLAKEKNINELIALFPADLPDVKLLLVGDGPEREALEAAVSARGLTDRVIFAGNQRQEDIPLFYRLGDLFCSASTSETQGLTYVEAMASGLPVLCRADSCLDDLVREGVNGWQYRDGDEYLDHLRTLLTDTKLHMDISLSAKESSRVYAQGTFASRVEALYRQLKEPAQRQRNFA